MHGKVRQRRTWHNKEGGIEKATDGGEGVGSNGKGLLGRP